MSGTLNHIFICSAAGEPMQEVESAEAIKGVGLKGDRYASGEGSWNRGKPGERQVTLINSLFFPESGFEVAEARRNLVVTGVELMGLIGMEFQFGTARFRGVKYCPPCARPSALVNKKQNFKDVFSDRGGLIAEVIKSGVIRKGDTFILLS